MVDFDTGKSGQIDGLFRGRALYSGSRVAGHASPRLATWSVVTVSLPGPGARTCPGAPGHLQGRPLLSTYHSQPLLTHTPFSYKSPSAVPDV